MGIFDSLFGNSQDKNSPNPDKTATTLAWTSLNRIEQLDQLVEDSNRRAVVIFKHSTSCGISRMVLKQFESEYDIEPGVLQPVYLDLKAYREVSNAIADRFGIRHESPQLLLIKNGTAVYSESHGGITVAALKEHI